jgi:hypothetical protein
MRNLANQVQRKDQQSSGLPRNVQEEIKRASREMSSASNSLRRQNTEIAASRGARAADRLRRLENMLHQDQKESLRQELEEIDKDLQGLADAQKQLSNEVQDLSQQASRNDTTGQAERLAEAQKRQEKLRKAYEAMQEQIRDMAEASRQSRDELGRGMNEFNSEMEKADVVPKMQQAEQLMQKGQLNSAARAETDIENTMERVQQDLVSLRGRLAESQEEKMELALNQTRRLREDLENLQQESQNQGNQQTQTNQRGQTQGQLAGPSESRSSSGEMDQESMRRWNEQLARNMDDLDQIQNSVGVDSSLAGQFSQLRDNWHGVIRNFAGKGSRDRFQMIEQLVMDPIKDLEAELAQRLELMKNTEKLYLAREERIPSEYRELVQKYYEAISETK